MLYIEGLHSYCLHIMRIRTDRKTISTACEQIKQFLSSDDLAQLNERLLIAQEVIDKINDLQKSIPSLPPYFFLENDVYESFVLRRWDNFIKVAQKLPYENRESEYIELLKLTDKFVNSVMSQLDNQVKSDGKTTIIIKDSIDKLKKSLSDERIKLNLLLKQLEQEKAKEMPNEDKIHDLQSQIDELQEKGKKLRISMDESQAEKMIENEWKSRIKNAFKELGTLTQQYESERKRTKNEFWLWVVVIIVDFLALSFWYYCFIRLIIEKTISIDNIISLIPFSVPTMLGIALFWIAIVQKNRASNLSLAITERLFNIHYLERLLMFVNDLSRSSNEAINTINKSVNEILNHYIENIGKDNIDFGKLSKAEKHELEANPLIDIINKLIDKVWKKEK